MGIFKTNRAREVGAFARHGPLPGSLLVVALLALAAATLPGASSLWAMTGQETPASIETSSGWTDYDAQPLRVNVWHDKDEGDIYRRGENVRVHFETNQDAYAVLYRIDAAGRVTVLWPKSRFDDGFVFGNHEYTLPANEAPPLRVAEEEGVEYIEALVSLYPFDLRNLEVDFHQEGNDSQFSFCVAGDPFLAMNEVNYAVTGLEDPADYVVTNYASYYVHRAVDHPRYLCNQCHDDDSGYDPYESVCVVQVHYDYGWYNGWYGRYGYYPMYYYPCYYYVDPWTWRPWINFWYVPWYDWPYGWDYRWPHHYYAWYDSPYYWGDAYVRYQAGHRRFTPLSRDYRIRDHERDSILRRRSSLFDAGRPTESMVGSMRTRTRLDDREALTVRGLRPGDANGVKEKYRDVKPVERIRTVFHESPKTIKSAPGLRIRGDENTRAGAVTRLRGTEELRSGDKPSAVDRSKGQDRSSDQDRNRVIRSPAERSNLRGNTAGDGKNKTDGKGTIRSVEPRKKGSRIWSGGRTSPSTERKARPGQVKPQDRNSGKSERSTPSRLRPQRAPSSSGSSKAKDVKPSQKSNSGDRSKSGAVKPSSPSRSGGGRSPAVQSAPSRRSGGEASSARSSGRSSAASGGSDRGQSGSRQRSGR
jgi:hypothetical protein